MFKDVLCNPALPWVVGGFSEFVGLATAQKHLPGYDFRETVNTAWHIVTPVAAAIGGMTYDIQRKNCHENIAGETAQAEDGL